MATEKKNKVPDFEEKMERLEDITALIQEGNIKMQESINLFEEAMQLINELNAELKKTEEKVKILIGGAEEIFGEDEE